MKIKTSITLSKDLLEEIDTIVEDSTSRSNFIEEALRNHLEHRRRLRREKTDLKIINRSADRLNKEAQDVLSYQVDLWTAEIFIEFSKVLRTTQSDSASSSLLAAKCWLTQSFQPLFALPFIAPMTAFPHRCLLALRKGWNTRAQFTVMNSSAFPKSNWRTSSGVYLRIKSTVWIRLSLSL